MGVVAFMRLEFIRDVSKGRFDPRVLGIHVSLIWHGSVPPVDDRSLEGNLKGIGAAGSKFVPCSWIAGVSFTVNSTVLASRQQRSGQPSSACRTCSAPRTKSTSRPSRPAPSTMRAGEPMEFDELDSNKIVVDDDVQVEWLKLVPGQRALPESAPSQGLSIVCCVEEKGTTADGRPPSRHRANANTQSMKAFSTRQGCVEGCEARRPQRRPRR